MNQILKIYLKGFLMGVCDLIPGISGGTIAFITGIYERLIIAIKHLHPKKYIQLFLSIIQNNKIKTKKLFKKLDVLFLLILFLGIISAILLGSNIIAYLLKNYYIYILSFFIGLILASSKIIYNHIEKHSYVNLLFGEIGLFIGFCLLFLVPTEISNPSFIYILFGGFLSIFALFLPGISGSFILLILGLYEFIINSISNISTEYKNLIPFGIGAILGIFIISRLISFLFKKDKCKTLYFLLGLVLGTLIIPIIYLIKSINETSILLMLNLIFLFLFGIYLILKIQK